MHTGLIHTLDLDRDGKTLSRIGMPFSVDRSPYFQVTIPICVARNGAARRAVDGRKSWRRIRRRVVAGAPDAQARSGAHARPRHHSADGECARCNGGAAQFAPRRRQSQSRFPRRPERTRRLLGSRIFSRKNLFPRHDVVFDIHSGGTAMAHLPCALIERQAEPARQNARRLDAPLGTPYGFVADNGQDAPTSMGAARRAGAIGVSGEFGGGGTTTTVSMAAAERAIDNLLLALGVVDAPVLSTGPTPEKPMRLLSLTRQSQAIYATRRALVQPATALGANVALGDVAGWLHDLERLEAPRRSFASPKAGSCSRSASRQCVKPAIASCKSQNRSGRNDASDPHSRRAGDRRDRRSVVPGGRAVGGWTHRGRGARRARGHGGIVEGRGRYLAPGFIDAHCHDDLITLRDPARPEKISRASRPSSSAIAASRSTPRPSDARDFAAATFFVAPRRNGPEEVFADFAAYRERLHKQGAAVNVVSLVGHAAIRLAAIGFEMRPATADERRRMQNLLAAPARPGCGRPVARVSLSAEFLCRRGRTHRAR